jgi:KEOPS complex subunit Cgi121
MELVTGTATVGDLDDFVADLGRIGDAHDCAVQAVDPRYVAGPDHLRRAVELADRSRARGENVARERAVEVLLYAAGRRQIDRALGMGIDEGEGPVAVLVAADPDAADPAAAERRAAEAVRELAAIAPGEVAYGDPGRLREFFGIGDAELAATDAALADLVLERVALLDVEK